MTRIILIEKENGCKRILTIDTIEGIVEYLRKNEGLYDWTWTDDEGFHSCRIEKPEWDGVETLRELEYELAKVDHDWWSLEVQEAETVTVEIPGLGNDCPQEFEVLSRENVIDLISGIEPSEISAQLIQLADRYRMSGIAYIYLDARTGQIEEGWLQQNTSLHPWDSFYEIVLMTEMTTEAGIYETLTDEWFFDVMDNEYDEYLEWREKNDGIAEDFLRERYGEVEVKKRLADIIEGMQEGMEMNDNIREQVDELYAYQTELY